MDLKVFIGWDSREQDAYDVCVHSLTKHSSIDLEIVPLIKADLIKEGLYQILSSTPMWV